MALRMQSKRGQNINNLKNYLVRENDYEIDEIKKRFYYKILIMHAKQHIIITSKTNDDWV